MSREYAEPFPWRRRMGQFEELLALIRRLAVAGGRRATFGAPVGPPSEPRKRGWRLYGRAAKSDVKRLLMSTRFKPVLSER
jgi:hypothetical protein